MVYLVRSWSAVISLADKNKFEEVQGSITGSLRAGQNLISHLGQCFIQCSNSASSLQVRLSGFCSLLAVTRTSFHCENDLVVRKLLLLWKKKNLTFCYIHLLVLFLLMLWNMIALPIFHGTLSISLVFSFPVLNDEVC